MNKKITLCAVLGAMLLISGCSDDFTTEQATEPPLGVDIIVPFATSTAAIVNPDPTDGLFIARDGKVKLNDDDLLNAAISGADSYGLESRYIQLKRGDASEEVSNLQSRLSTLGYYNGDISGVFDEDTEKAVKLFEACFGITHTGIATPALQERLYSENAFEYNSRSYTESVNSFYKKLSEGDTGAAVLSLQNRLLELGYFEGEVTGTYDEATVEAVGKFYKMYGKKPKKYANADLQKMLYSSDAPVYDAERKYVAPTEAPENNEYDYTLRSGDTGNRVKQLQTRLVELGYLKEVTGTYDEATVEAVSDFQNAVRVEMTGIATEAVQKELYSQSAPEYGVRLDIYKPLQWGDSGDFVTKLQKRLIELGYYDGVATGIYDDATAQAVSAFESAVGEEMTGVASPELQDEIYSNTAPASEMLAVRRSEDEAAAHYVFTELKKGNSGESVVELQTRLTELGYYTGSADGNFGGGTEAAVKRLQRNLGVEVNGRCTSDLLNTVFSSAAPPNGMSIDSGEYITIIEGDYSEGVVKLQKRLYQLGYLEKADIEASVGLYEKNTMAAVNDAMKAAGCRLRDGRCSAEFQAYLFSDLSENIKINAQ